jgi:hypothetical protein
MRKVASRLVLALAVVALALPMMAKSPKPAKTDAKAKSTTLNIYQPIKFGGTVVKAGSYKLVIDGEKATLEDGKKMVASSSGHWEDRKQKADSTGFETTDGAVQDVFIHGETSVFVLSGS